MGQSAVAGTYTLDIEAPCPSKNIDVILKSGGGLTIGDPSDPDFKATVVVHAGNSIKIESGGYLKVSDGSKLIIEYGANIFYDAGAAIQLDGDGHIEFKNGSLLRLGDDATLTIIGGNSGKGYLSFENNFQSPDIIGGTNASIDLEGSGTGNILLEIGGNAGMLPQSHIPMTFKNMGVRMKPTGPGYTGLHSYNDLTMEHVKIDNAYGASYKHGGLHIYGQPKISIKNCSFVEAYSGIAAPMYGGNSLNLLQCTFANCVNGIHITWGGFKLNQCVFQNCNNGIKAEAIALNSKIEGCDFDGTSSTNSSGINIAGSSRSIELLVKSTKTHEFTNGIMAWSATVLIDCVHSYDNANGFLALPGSKIISGSNFSNYKTGDLWMKNNSQSDIWFDVSQLPMVENGSNTFGSSSHMTGVIANATPPELKAGGNYWSYYYPNNNVKKEFPRVPLPVNTFSISMDNHRDCFTEWDYVRCCTGEGKQYMKEQIQKMPYSEGLNPNVYTSNFSGVSIDYAIVNIAPDMTNADDFRGQLMLLPEVLQYPFEAELNKSDVNVMMLGYDKMMTLLNLGIDSGTIIPKDSEEVIDDAITAVRATQDYMLSVIDTAWDGYRDSFKLTIDKASTYFLCSDFENGLSVLNSMNEWTHEDDQPFLQYLICTHTKIQAVRDSTLTPHEADSIYDCVLPLPDIHRSDPGLTLEPNPTTGIFTASAIIPEGLDSVTIVIKDVIGIERLRQRIAVTDTIFNQELDITALSEAPYFVNLAWDGGDLQKQINKISERRAWCIDSLNLEAPGTTFSYVPLIGHFFTPVNAKFSIYDMEGAMVCGSDTFYTENETETDDFTIDEYPYRYCRAELWTDSGTINRIIKKESTWPLDTNNLTEAPFTTTDGHFTIATYFDLFTYGNFDIINQNDSIVFHDTIANTYGPFYRNMDCLEHQPDGNYRVRMRNTLGEITRTFEKKSNYTWNTDSENVSIYPVPIIDWVTVNTYFDEYAYAHIEVKNISNEVLIQTDIENVQGDYTRYLDLSALNAGVYIINVVADNKRINRTIIKI